MNKYLYCQHQLILIEYSYHFVMNTIIKIVNYKCKECCEIINNVEQQLKIEDLMVYFYNYPFELKKIIDWYKNEQ